MTSSVRRFLGDFRFIECDNPACVCRDNVDAVFGPMVDVWERLELLLLTVDFYNSSVDVNESGPIRWPRGRPTLRTMILDTETDSAADRLYFEGNVVPIDADNEADLRLREEATTSWISPPMMIITNFQNRRLPHPNPAPS